MRNGCLLAEGPPDNVMKQHCATVSDTQGKVAVGVTTKVTTKVTTFPPSLLQTLEGAFLRLCETSDHMACKQESSPPGGLENSQSFESGRDESRPILTVGARFGDDVPKYTGTGIEEMPFLTYTSANHL